jgi:CTP:molybdopterin cytidylyltransferase MocA
MLLAAGAGRRMGGPKAFLSFGEKSFLEVLIEAVLESSVDGLVVVASRAVEEVLSGNLPEDCCIAVNPDPDSEMLASVRLGLHEARSSFDLADDDGVMILLCDQPQVSAGTITTCAEAFRLPRRPPGILIATYQGRRGHPAVFRHDLLAKIDPWPPGRRLNELAALHPNEIRELPIATASFPIDVNTPQDYDRLRRDTD